MVQGRVICSISVNSLAKCEKLLSYVSLFPSVRESDLCVPVA